METTRLIHCGLGAMGAGMVRLVQEKDGLRSVGAVDADRTKHGRDLGDVAGLDRELGLQVASTLAAAMPPEGADLMLLATASFAKEVGPQIIEAASAGLNVITIAEEMAYPWRGQPELARTIDAAAREHGVTVLGTGINPGFVLDTLIIALTGACERVDSIRAARINDLSPFGPTVLRTQGVGVSPEEFARGVQDGSIVGHVGFPESMAMIAQALGWQLGEIREVREPIVAAVARETPYITVAPGQVAGCRHVGCAYSEGGRQLIKLEHPQQVQPEAEGVETGDYIWIEGRPPVSLTIKPEIPGGMGTVAVAVNMIPAVLAHPPGLVDMTCLPLPRAIPGRAAAAAGKRE